VGTQHPAVSDAHPVVSAQSQLRTCEDARPQCTNPRGGFRGSINLLTSRTPVPSRNIGQGRDSKPSESGVKPHGKKISGRSFRFPRPGWNDRDPRASLDSQPVIVAENHVS
jgi:hypothetical protein